MGFGFGYIYPTQYPNPEILKHFNYIEDEIEEISFPQFVQSTLHNHIKYNHNKIFCINYLFFLSIIQFIYILIKVPNPDK